ncbi:hypothetical protein DFH07DRAFT_840531 [Mycena maculata]|uniref:Uncharacterized protein n=1 Tax=Mycena maculata TaxID=230809 RepID=A0AAD7ICN5_9AGAR|nr:hypothetical protein DFH07DRAFT_840531 [Mycena maculata]
MLGRHCLRILSAGIRCNSSVANNDTKKFFLKNWQKDAVDACVNAVHAGLTRIGMQLAAADAKGTMLPVLMDRIPPPQRNSDATRLLVVTVSQKRAEKLAEELKKQPYWDVDLDKKKATAVCNADIFITTFTDATKERVVRRYDHSKVKAIFLDQAHKATPVFYELLMSWFDPARGPDTHQPIVIGASASAEEVLGALGYFEQIVYRRKFIDALEESWECNARFAARLAPIHLAEISEKQWHTKLSVAMSRPLVLESTVQAWLDMAATRQSTLVWCVDNKHAKTLAAAFLEAGVDAEVRIPGKPDDDDAKLACEAQTAAFKAGELPVLLVPRSDVSEIDMPWIDCVLIASPTPGKDALGNMIRPGMKMWGDKADTLIIEVVDRKKSPSYDIRDLLQLEYQKINGETLDVLRHRAVESSITNLERAVGAPTKALRPALDVEQLPASPALAQQEREEVEDRALNAANESRPKRRWVRCASGIYVHDCFNRGHAILRELEIQEGPAMYEAWWTPRQLDSEVVPEAAARKLSEPGPFDDVMAEVNEFLLKKHTETLRDRQLKASVSQLRALRDFAPPTMAHVLCNGEPMMLDDFLEWLTAEDASTALARLRYNTECPDGSGFTYKEQAAILAKMRANIRPWEALIRMEKALKGVRPGKKGLRPRIDHEVQRVLRREARKAFAK